MADPMTRPNLQDFSLAQERVLKSDPLFRYHNDLLFRYWVDASVGVALRDRERQPGVRVASKSEINGYRVGAIFALSLREHMPKF